MEAPPGLNQMIYDDVRLGDGLRVVVSHFTSLALLFSSSERELQSFLSAVPCATPNCPGMILSRPATE